MGLIFTLFSVRIASDRDKSGAFRKLVDDLAPGLPSADTAAVSLIKIIDESTHEKDGGESPHVDGTRLPWRFVDFSIILRELRKSIVKVVSIVVSKDLRSLFDLFSILL